MTARFDGSRMICIERFQAGGEAMSWVTPSFEEVKMDAEINSYQEDLV